MRALGALLAAIAGALACGGLFFALGTLLALEAFAAHAFSTDRTYVLLVAAFTTCGAHSVKIPSTRPWRNCTAAPRGL